MKVVLIMFKDRQRRDFPLQANRTVLGRRQDCGLRIPTGDVSRQHCEIAVGRQDVVVRDLGSTNGTYVNGKRIAETKLRPGDRLMIGPVVFVVQIDGRPADIKPTDAARPTMAPAAREPVEEEVFDLDETDFDLEDPLSALGTLPDQDEDQEDKKNKKK